jgi:hypothetical protein
VNIKHLKEVETGKKKDTVRERWKRSRLKEQKRENGKDQNMKD